MKSPSSHLVSLSLTGCLLAGCMPRPVIPKATPNPQIKIQLTLQPQSPRQLDPTQFLVTLHDAQNHPLLGAFVSLQLLMPSMAMGRDDAALKPHGAGVYAGTGRFSMPGSWLVVVTAKKGRQSTVQTFPVTVRG
jgi:nitrogen fixation protein FixH